VLSGQAHFETGETVLLFLRARPDGILFPAGMERGKWAFYPERDAVAPPNAAAVRLGDISNALEGADDE